MIIPLSTGKIAARPRLIPFAWTVLVALGVVGFIGRFAAMGPALHDLLGRL